MKRKHDLSSDWNTDVRYEKYMILVEPDEKIKKGDILKMEAQYGTQGQYLVNNVYNARIIDVIDDDIVFKWYFANLVKYALQHDSEIPSHKKLDSQMSYAEWNEKLKKTLGTCILNHYGEPKERIVKVVIFSSPICYKPDMFAEFDEPNWKRVKKLL